MSRLVPDRTIGSPNDEFQLLEALLTNRNKRHRQGRFLIQGVNPIDAALAADWPVEAVLSAVGSERSDWARGVLDRLGDAERVAMPQELLDVLGERDEGCELVLVGTLPSTDLTRRPLAGDAVWVLAENVGNPGNLGTLVRSCDAFGVHGLVVTSRSADPFDPQAVRASVGSIFSMPVAVVDGIADAVETLLEDDQPVRVVGLDEDGTPIDEVDLEGPIALVAGSEARGLTRRAREVCDVIAAIPMTGTASSLNVAVATSIALHEVRRRRS